MNAPKITTHRLESAYTAEQWKQLETDVFDGAGEALSLIREHARAKIIAPVPFLITCAQRALTSLPGRACFDAGAGRGSLNTFVMLVGKPGEGKDATVSAVRQALTVTRDGREITVRDFGLGSGEGVVSLLEPEEDSPAEPVLFGASEIGQVAALMGRKGATLRPTLLSIYSGNPLGFSNKHERSYVEANSYSAGVWIGCQPDKAGAVLDGADDGFKHRFIWSEMFDPHTTATVDDVDAPVPALRPVEVPESIMKGTPFTYAPEIVTLTRQNSLNRVRYGMQNDTQGHRHQTQLKLAAGLALLRSSARVSMDDWRRAGALMAYSDAVIARCQAHLDQERVRDEAERLERRDQADDRVHRNRVARNRRRILEALADDRSEETVKWYPLMRARPGRERGSMAEALQELINEGAVTPHLDERNETEALSWGGKFEEVCGREGVSCGLRAVS